jgi:hypothetical protein
MYDDEDSGYNRRYWGGFTYWSNGMQFWDLSPKPEEFAEQSIIEAPEDLNAVDNWFEESEDLEDLEAFPEDGEE